MALTGREIITLQFGHYSNFIGTHWWNCQEAGFDYSGQTVSEIDHDVLFREGQTRNGQVTFTPRLLLVDLKGSLGTLPEDGGLYEEPPLPDPSLPLWPQDKVDVQIAPREEKNEFLQDLDQAMTVEYKLPSGLTETDTALPKVYNLDNSVKTWSDYLRVHFHPRTITVINQYQHNSTTQPFDTFDAGEALWRKPLFSDDFVDYVRLYLEEANNLQGFQILLDSYDGFAGLSSACLQHLQDEYPSKTIIAFPCLPAEFTESSRVHISTRAVNMALSAVSLSELSGLFTPLSCSVALLMAFVACIFPLLLVFNFFLMNIGADTVAELFGTSVGNGLTKYMTPVRAIWSLVPKDKEWQAIFTLLAGSVVTFLIIRWSLGLKPTLTRKCRHQFIDMGTYIKDTVKNKKEQLYKEYLGQSVGDHDL